MNRLLAISLSIFLSHIFIIAADVASPSDRVRLSVGLDKEGAPVYSVTFDGSKRQPYGI